MHRYSGVKFFHKADPAFSGTLYDRSRLSTQAFALTEEALFSADLRECGKKRLDLRSRCEIR